MVLFTEVMESTMNSMAVTLNNEEKCLWSYLALSNIFQICFAFVHKRLQSHDTVGKFLTGTIAKATLLLTKLLSEVCEKLPVMCICRPVAQYDQPT